MSNVLIAGAGRMGKCLAYDAVKWSGNTYICDSDPWALKQAGKIKGVHTIHITKLSDIKKILKDNNINILISCLPYKHNYLLTQMCIDNKISMTDLGGNIDIVQKQLSLSIKARRNRVTIIPDCGLAPGMSNILAGELFKSGYRDSIKIRVGGLPYATHLPLKYGLVFSIDGLVNEYITDVISIDNWKIMRKKPLKDITDFDLHSSFDKTGISKQVKHQLEIASTSGGTSTLPYSFQRKIRELNYKTIRYKGHYEQVKRQLNGYSFIKSRSSMEKWNKLKQYLTSKLKHTSKDIVLLAIEGRNKHKTRGFTMYHKYNNKHTAMMETTAYSASVVASMIAKGTIRKRGVIDQETNIDYNKFTKQLEKRGITINSY